MLLLQGQGECAVLGVHSKVALKSPMMARLRTTPIETAPTEPRKEGMGVWAASQPRLELISARIASIWKWVPTTAQIWKSW